MSTVVDSKHQELSVDEIIGIAAQETRSEYSPEQIKAVLLAEAHGAGAICMREGNTLFIVHKTPNNPAIGVFRALNADTAKNYCQNAVTFTKAIGMAGFKTLVTEFDDPAILNVIKFVSRHPPFPNMGYATQRTEDGGYRVTINLGQTQQQGGLPQTGTPIFKGAL